MFFFLVSGVHLASTWFMTGLIWFVQVVHYPLFSLVGEERFPQYEGEHSRKTTWVVLPVMTAELLSSLVLWWFWPSFLSALGLGLVGVIWLSTLLVQAPLHGQLLAGFEEQKWRKLVASNRLRTAVWTARGILALIIYR